MNYLRSLIVAGWAFLGAAATVFAQATPTPLPLGDVDRIAPLSQVIQRTTSYEGSVVTMLKNVTTVATSASVVPRSNRRVVHVIIGGTATVFLDGSLDNVNWQTFSSGMTTSTSDSNSDPWRYVRARVTVCTGCTVTVLMGT